MTGFLLIRHATCSHVGRVLVGRSQGVRLDFEGRRQAARLADRLAGAPLEAVYSSPLERALETATPLAQRLGLEVRVSDAITEIDVGRWTGRSLEELEEDEEWRAWNVFRSGARAPDGESALEVAARVVGELRNLRALHPGAWVALVTHADVIRTAVAHLAGLPLDLMLRVEVDPASLTALLLYEDGASIVRLNESFQEAWEARR